MAIVNTKNITATPVLYAATPLVLTDNCDSDVATAMMRGLAEYIATQSTQWKGQVHTLAECYYEWPEPEDTAKFPSALVRMNNDVIYDARTLSGPDINDSAEPDHSNPRKRIAEVSEAIATLQIVVRANSPQELRQRQ